MEEKINYYHRTIAIWDKLCELHKDLNEATSQEYIFLLGGNVDEIEASITAKELVIHEINLLDKSRNKLLSEINEKFNLKTEQFF